MTPKQLVDYLEEHGISKSEFAARLGVTPALISFWIKKNGIVYERQCQIQVETKGKLRASWRDEPKERREKRAA